MLSTSADRRRVVVPRYARLVIVLLLLSLLLSIYLSFSSRSLRRSALSVPLCRSLARISMSAHTEGLDLDRHPPLLASRQNSGVVFVPPVRCSFFHRNRSFHARAGSSYRDSASLSFFVVSFLSVSPCFWFSRFGRLRSVLGTSPAQLRRVIAIPLATRC